MFKKAVCLIVLGLLCSSCTIPNRGAVDLTNLRSSDQKYGVVVMRSMFFKNRDDAELFLQGEPSLAREISNEAHVYAKGDVGTVDEFNSLQLGYQIGGVRWHTDDEKERKKLFGGNYIRNIVNIEVPTTFKPEYFYTITMLPVGDYYISAVTFNFHYKSHLEQRYDRKDSQYRFSVKAGQVNYLGDLYFLSPQSSGFIFRTHSANVALRNEFTKAKAFIKKFHPELDLPVVDTPLKSAN